MAEPSPPPPPGVPSRAPIDIDELYREEVLRARRAPPDQKLLTGGDLFESACQRMAAGLRFENPGATEETIVALLRARLDRLRRLSYSYDRQ